MAFRNRLRFEVARQMIESGATPSEVVARINLPETSKLSRTFKKLYGVSPRYCRARENPNIRQTDIGSQTRYDQPGARRPRTRT